MGQASRALGVLTMAQPNPVEAKPITIAVLAMGGEGGGVLADWLVAMGEANDFIAQTTSVPGVAQRTGATIYYVELFAGAAARAANAQPVLALMPLPGEVDVVLASELMEAARAVQRGLVTPSRTALVMSTHRVYAMSEKTAMADGRADSSQLWSLALQGARQVVGFDMAEVAQQQGSVISAVLFGALAASGALPFARQAYEDTIRAGGIGVKTSLAAFDAGYAMAQLPPQPPYTDAPAAAPETPDKPSALPPHAQAWADRVWDAYPATVRRTVWEGLRRLVDYQDVAYAESYLNQLDALRDALEPSLLEAVARHLALWMSYEDTPRVADLKLRQGRWARVRDEVQAQPAEVVEVYEYLHPRFEEICDTLPAHWATRIENSGWMRALLKRMTRSGRVLHTNSLHGFALLGVVAAMRRWRRQTRRYAREHAQMHQWLQRIRGLAAEHPALALEVANCQGLIKGYSDTHARGWNNFARIMQTLDDAPAPLQAAQLRGLREAALADDSGKALDQALSSLRSGSAGGRHMLA